MKVTIVGTGHVGATLGYVIVLEGLAENLVLVNRNRSVAEGHAMDLRHTLRPFPTHPPDHPQPQPPIHFAPQPTNRQPADAND